MHQYALILHTKISVYAIFYVIVRPVQTTKRNKIFRSSKGEQAAAGPSKSTRSRTWNIEKVDNEGSIDRTILSVTTLGHMDGASFEVEIVDGNESHTAIGRNDDGADKSIVSSRIAEHAVLNGLGKMKRILPLTLQVPSKEGSNATKCTFSQSWTASRTVLKLSPVPLALLSIKYFVAETDLEVEDLLIERSVLSHLDVVSKTLLEHRRSLLDKTDCSSVSPNNRRERVGTLMIPRLNHISTETSNDGDETTQNLTSQGELVCALKKKIDYWNVRREEDTFPDPSMPTPLDIDQDVDIDSETSRMLQEAFHSGLPEENKAKLRQTVISNVDVFKLIFPLERPQRSIRCILN